MDAEYAALYLDARRPATDDMLMMWPPAWLCARLGPRACVNFMGTSRFKVIILSQVSTSAAWEKHRSFMHSIIRQINASNSSKLSNVAAQALVKDERHHCQVWGLL